VPEFGNDFPAGLLPADYLAPLTASGRS
jgi:hypothetical protein